MGTNPTISVHGENLLDQFGVTSASVSDSGVSASVSGPDPDNPTVSLSIASNASSGTHSFTMSNSFGTSNAESFTVGYPAAAIASVAPPIWIAGQTFPVIITGTGFGTQPTVTISALGVTPVTTTTTSDGKTINIPSVSVAASAPYEPVSVQVQPGYIGSGFICGTACTGNGQATSTTPVVQPVTPAPKIMIVNTTADLAQCTNGTLAASGNNETDVAAGQQMLLCVVQPGNGLSVVSSQWSFDNNINITGGFTDFEGTGGPPSATVGGSEAADPSLTGTSLKFYFVNPGTTETASYHWTLSNGDTAGASTTADFNIQGPTNISVTAPVTPVTVINSLGSVVFRMGSSVQAGITLTATSGILESSAGSNASFQWVQLITDTAKEGQGSKINSCATQGYPSLAIDQFYPYPHAVSSPPSTTNDSPASAPLGGDLESEYARSFHAKTYLMWDPALPSGCTPAKSLALGGRNYLTAASTCASIPVPLGYVNWATSADAIQTLGNNPNNGWSLSCANPQQASNGPSFIVSSEFPQWNYEDISIYSPNRFGNDVCQAQPR